MQIPVNMDGMVIKKAPKWILVVEKYSVYERLVQVKYGTEDHGLIITGRGQPDRATRNLVSVLSSRIPSFALVDPDPCGIDIYLTYRIGSWQMNHEENLKSGSLHLIGVLPSHLKKFKIPEQALLPLSSSDHSRIENMKRKIIARRLYLGI